MSISTSFGPVINALRLGLSAWGCYTGRIAAGMILGVVAPAGSAAGSSLSLSVSNISSTASFSDSAYLVRFRR